MRLSGVPGTSLRHRNRQAFNLKPVLALLMISVAFLGGSSLHALAVEPEPDVQTEYIFISTPNITFGPQKATEQVFVPNLVAESTPTTQQPLTPTVEEAEAEEDDTRKHDTESLIALLGRTPWPVRLWPSVLRLVECESTTDERAIGDTNLTPLTGPSYGLTQINISAHPAYHRSYDLLDGRENLLAAWGVFIEANYSFEPWSCAP